jgi:hypothetical protein
MNQQQQAINTICINHTQDWTLENSSLLPDYSSKNNLEKVSNSHFNNMKMAKNCNGASDSENNRDMCHQKMNEHGDHSAHFHIIKMRIANFFQIIFAAIIG